MRTLCDVCEGAAATLFCAADEAALCLPCDEKVHMCNKLASRHVRVGLADPNDVPRCDICENSPAFFYCEIDGTSLCLQCDMAVHVGGKRTHARYLLLRQRAEFVVDKSAQIDEVPFHPMDSSEKKQNQPPKMSMNENHENHRVPSVPVPPNAKDDNNRKMDINMFDLNTKPNRTNGEASSNHGVDDRSVSNHESASMGPVGSCDKEVDK